MMELTHLSLFSGIGGLDLAAEWAGIKTVGQCEWAEYPSKVLERHWPDVPRWKDIRTLTGESFYERTGRRTVDIISGGFPCQPFSVAGKQRGRADDRFLWPEMARIIKELRPAWIVGENVAGIVRMELPGILSELEACGYRTRAFLVPACAVGARHRRYRVAIVGHAEHNGLSATAVQGITGTAGRMEQEREETSCEPAGAGGSGHSKDVADTMCADGKRAGTPGIKTGLQESADRGGNVPDTDNRSGTVRWSGEPQTIEETGNRRCDIRGRKEEHEQWERWTAEPGLGGVADGLPGWVDGYWDVEPEVPRIATGIRDRVSRLKALGNAVVPRQFYPVFKAIADVERRCLGDEER